MHTVFVIHAGSIPGCDTFFLGFPLVSSFVQVIEMLFVLISLSKRFNFIQLSEEIRVSTCSKNT